MSVDTVNYALTNVRLRFLRNPENFSPEGQRKLLAMCDYMRDCLMQEDVQGFNQYVSSILAREPDAADFLLEELFYELGFPEGAREQLDEALAA
jgi:hypothetical protein